MNATNLHSSEEKFVSIMDYSSKDNHAKMPWYFTDILTVWWCN